MICLYCYWYFSHFSLALVDAPMTIIRQTLSAASTLRNSADNSNAGDVLKDVDAVIFTGGEDVSPTLLAIGLQFHPKAAVVKHLTGAANKDSFMSLEEAKGL